MKKTIATLLLTFSAVQAHSVATWYTGEINRIWTYGSNGDFIITFSGNSSIGDCQHKYAYFRSVDISETLLKNTYAMALSAFHSGSKVGIVIDKGDVNTDCYAMSLDIRK